MTSLSLNTFLLIFSKFVNFFFMKVVKKIFFSKLCIRKFKKYTMPPYQITCIAFFSSLLKQLQFFSVTKLFKLKYFIVLWSCNVCNPEKTYLLFFFYVYYHLKNKSSKKFFLETKFDSQYK